MDGGGVFVEKVRGGVDVDVGGYAVVFLSWGISWGNLWGNLWGGGFVEGICGVVG